VKDSEIHSLIGDEGFRRLVAAFYRRVPHDDILGRMYPAQDLEAAEQRLRDFLVFRFGGPPRYIEQRGHPQLRMRHARFEIGIAARDRWVQLMNAASVASSPAHSWYSAHDIETMPSCPRCPRSIISRPTSQVGMSRRPSKRSIENASQSFAGT